jgi:hypothetical protein
MWFFLLNKIYMVFLPIDYFNKIVTLEYAISFLLIFLFCFVFQYEIQ